MNNLFFKSDNRLIKNSSCTLDDLLSKLLVMQSQLRLLRTDNQDMSLKLDKLLIDKHLQMQVDNYFDDDEEEHPPSADGPPELEDK